MPKGKPKARGMKFFGLFKVFKKKKKRDEAFLIQEDIKNIDQILYKKEKHLREIEHLDKKIVLIQKSTKTTIPQLRPLHDSFRQKYKWYYNWHLSPYARPIHMVFLLFYILTLGYALSYLIKPITKVNAQTTYDVPRWDWMSSKPVGNNLVKVTSCSDDHSIWAVGAQGTIVYSTDNGVTWQSDYSGTTNDLADIYCVKRNDTTDNESDVEVVAVGKSGTILYRNKYAWTQYGEGVSTKDLSKIIYETSVGFVVIGGDKILNSTDGKTWALASTGGLTTGKTLKDVTYGNNRFIAVGTGGLVIYSDNSTTWNAATTTDSFGAGSINAVLYGEDRFALAGDSNKLMVSTNGADNWADVTNYIPGQNPPVTNPTNLKTLVYTYGFVALGDANYYVWYENSPPGSADQWRYESYPAGSGDTPPSVPTCKDRNLCVYANAGISYSSRNSILSVGSLEKNAGHNKVFAVAVQNLGNLGAIGLRNVTYNGTSFVIVGDNGLINYGDSNGENWQSANTSIYGVFNFIDYYSKIAYFPSFGYYALGKQTLSTPAKTVISRSVDAINNWQTSYTTDIENPSDMVCNSTRCVKSKGDWINYSNNGTDWLSGICAAIADVGLSNFFQGFATSGNEFIGIGGSSSSLSKGIVYAADGITWAKATGVGLFDKVFTKAVYGNNKYVSVGTDTIYYSDNDGTDWTAATAVTGSFTGKTFINVIYDSTSGKYVALASNGAAFYSIDGVNWNIATGLSGTLNSITFSGSKFVIVGSSGVIFDSTDGASWTSRTNPDASLNNLNSVAYSDKAGFVAVGDNGMSLRSSDGVNWVINISGLTTKKLRIIVNTPYGLIAGGEEGVLLRFYSPAIPTATKLTVSSSSTTAKVGENFPVIVHSVDNSGDLDKGIKYSVHLRSNDPNASNSGSFSLDNGLGASCSDTGGGRPAKPCGVGTSNYVFHTAGDWTVYADDTGGSGLASGQSTSTVHVNPGNPSKMTFSGLSTSLSAGVASGSITLQAKDLYGNNTTVGSNTTVNLKTTASSSGRFSTDGTSWSVGEINLTIPAGSGSVTFYYLDLATGNPTITATSSGLTTTSFSINITAGELTQSTLTLSRNSIHTGESLSALAHLQNSQGIVLSGKTIRLVSSRSGDTTGGSQVTDNPGGNATFTVSAIQPGSFTLIIYDVSDGIYATASATVEVIGTDLTSVPVSADTSTLTTDKERIDPGTGVANITVRLLDTSGNPVRGKSVSITSSRAEDKITPVSAITSDDGSASFSFSSDNQGDSTIVAQDITDNLVLKAKLVIRVAPATILDRIKESPVAKAIVDVLAPVSKAIALLGLIPLILQLLQAIPSVAPLASSVFPILFTTASVSRRKKPWGNVFDSLTGRPVDLAVVRLYRKGTDKLISTQVTDFDGRFHFLAGTGTYYIKVEKKGYSFPVKISKFKASQLSSRFGKDSDIYLGVPFSVQNKNAQINLNIPLEPVYEKLTSNIKFRKTARESFDWFLIGVSYVAVPLMLTGAVIAALTTIVHATNINFITDGAYLVLLSGFLVTSRIRENRMGKVYDSKSKLPIAGAMVTVYDSEYNAIRQTQNTDKNGNFAILAQKGAYYIIVEKTGYKFPSATNSTKKQPIYTGGTINKPKAGFIGIDVPMDKS